MDKYIEGYWAPSKDKQDLWSFSQEVYPFPVGREKPWEGQEAFLNDLSVVEEKAARIGYRGMSFCRLCGGMNGSEEFVYRHEDTKYVWPSGFRHYVEDHNVLPTQKFRDMVKAAAAACTLPAPDKKSANTLAAEAAPSVPQGNGYGQNLPQGPNR